MHTHCPAAAGPGRQVQVLAVLLASADTWMVPDERRGAFEAFVRESSGPLFGQAYLLAGDRHSAQDLVQETFVRVWQHWGRVSTYDNPMGWARHVLHNLAVSRWRRHKVQARVTEVDVPAAAPDIGHLDVVEALGRLPERQRRAIVLHDVVGMSVEEVAVEMNAPQGSVRAWLSRSRAALAADLKAGDPEAAT
jgi:RNA polymerase sigma-70 factor (ECF subfamily)